MTRTNYDNINSNDGYINSYHGNIITIGHRQYIIKCIFLTTVNEKNLQKKGNLKLCHLNNLGAMRDITLIWSI